MFFPVSRDRLLSGMVEDRGDIVAASLTITPARQALVDFADLWITGVSEINVTGPASPRIGELTTSPATRSSCAGPAASAPAIGRWPHGGGTKVSLREMGVSGYVARGERGTSRRALIGKAREPRVTGIRKEDRIMTWAASVVVAALTLATSVLVGCSTAPANLTERDELPRKAQTERQEWNKLDPGIEALARSSHGVAFFPEITKGGPGVGGAYGRSVVFEQGQPIGYADVTQGSIGLQSGAQTYSEAIVFENKAAKNARFVDGVAVLVRPTAGAMAEASLGGQRVTFVPK
jgi:hypothetical protein